MFFKTFENPCLLWHYLRHRTLYFSTDQLFWTFIRYTRYEKKKFIKWIIELLKLFSNLVQPISEKTRFLSKWKFSCGTIRHKIEQHSQSRSGRLHTTVCKKKKFAGDTETFPPGLTPPPRKTCTRSEWKIQSRII